MRRAAALLLATVAVAAGCGGGDDDGSASSEAAPLTCHTASRPAVTEPIDDERVVELAAEEGAVHDHGRLVWHAEHSVDPGEGEALVVRVEATDGALVTSSLFQLDGTPRDQFRGGHGFTGLQYAYDPQGGELQWWCASS